MLRALAVDDEKPSLEELLYLLNADPRVGSAEGASDATEALRRINRALESGPDGPEAIDVVFLDIQMAGLDGLDLARLLTGFARPPLVVFVTAHEGFAVQAFDLKAVDYVLKPVRRERLAEAIRRAAQLREATTASAPPIPVHEPDPDQIPVELGGVTRFVAVDDITHVEAQGDYARLHTPRAATSSASPCPPSRSAGAHAGSSASTAAISSPCATSANSAWTRARSASSSAPWNSRSAAVTHASCAIC